MARINKITDNTRPIILKLQAEGKTALEIKAELCSKHNIIIGYKTLRKYLNDLKEERIEVAKQEYAKVVASTVNTDLQIVDDMVFSLRDQYLKLIKNVRYVSTANNFAKTLLNYIQFRASLNGLDYGEPKQPDEELLKGLMEKLGK